MTTDEIHSFIHRLMRRELQAGELAALTTRDLGDINAYLAEYAMTDSGTPSAGAPTPAKPGMAALCPGRIYSEEEILLEFGVLE